MGRNDDGPGDGRAEPGDTVIGNDVWLGYAGARAARGDGRSRRRRGSERRHRRCATHTRSSPGTRRGSYASASTRRTLAGYCGQHGGIGQSGSSPSTRDDHGRHTDGTRADRRSARDGPEPHGARERGSTPTALGPQRQLCGPTDLPARHRRCVSAVTAYVEFGTARLFPGPIPAIPVPATQGIVDEGQT